MTMPPPALSGSPVLMTATEFTARYENRHAELVEGLVKEYPVPQQRHGQICGMMSGFLWQHVVLGNLGHITTNDSFIQTNRDPDTIRAADICYFSYERLPRGPLPEGILPVVPELVVEVRSPTDRWTEVFTKVGEYLRAGVRVIVVLDPVSETASVYRDDTLQQTFHKADTLVLPDVLPGFAVPVSRLFA